MNILSKLDFSSEKPAVLNLRKSENTHILAVGLTKDQLLSKHTTAVPTLLIVLKGTIQFNIENKSMILKTYDTYPIPPHILHEAQGVEQENAFVLVKDNHIV
jgi:quercetin dioxygenase-like cupin family protein